MKVPVGKNFSNEYRYTVQLKGNLTHADGAHATYWLKVHGFINPYWQVWEGKPTKINF